VHEVEIETTSDERVRHLQEELQLAQTRLRATREESEAANEELRAANEELQSINEEYRSTSEELETSKEELQSINEELQTVNNELKLKLESVSRAHSDLYNFMSATDIATLFLDTSLCIKRFTSRLTDLFNVTANDEGRPITDFTHQLEYDDLADHVRGVLADLAPVEHEVKTRNNGWYLVRIRPYRTVEDKVDGVIATFVDISERRRAEEALRHSETRLRQEMRLVEMSRSPIFCGISMAASCNGIAAARNFMAILATRPLGSAKKSCCGPPFPAVPSSHCASHWLRTAPGVVNFCIALVMGACSRWKAKSSWCR
jgi:two-component system, chemotaxis family, CheB/CheR fusion protein